MKILDTDILVGILRGNSDAINKMNELKESNENLAVTIFNEQEILFGALLAKNIEKVFKPAKEFIDSFQKLNYEEEDMLKTIKILVYLKKKGFHIGLIDEMIAGICLRYKATIVTRNIEHFSKVPKLKIEKW
jgi:predicted nucleic acid-binding protein